MPEESTDKTIGKPPIALTQCTTQGDAAEKAPLEISENRWLGKAKHASGLYIHIPFCFHKCHYCDFFSIAHADDEHEPFARALVNELEHVGPNCGELDTVFIGGGTPTLLENGLLERVLSAIRDSFHLSEDVEWTVEANPETVTESNAAILANAGVNRVSIGAQTFHPHLLKELERWHDPRNVIRSVELLRSSGIDNINLDLIYAIPTETMPMLQSDLQQLIDLSPEHLSCYALTFEPNTPLEVKLRKGAVSKVEHELEAEMFKVVSDTLLQHGYHQYEISNFAKRGFECKHNVMYWENKSWWACGPAAAGHVDGLRWRNVPRLRDYYKQNPLPPVVDVEQLSVDQQMGEVCMLGLRLTRGIPRATVKMVIQQSPDLWRGAVIDSFIQDGLLEWKNDSLAFTKNGRIMGDVVIGDLLMKDG